MIKCKEETENNKRPRNMVKAFKKPKKDGLKGENPSGEKTDWRKLKEEKKALKLQRKREKCTYEVATNSKKIYEQLKCKKTDRQIKLKLSTELYGLLKKNDGINKVIMAHDTARVIQCLFKYSSAQIKKNISEELLPISVQMATSKYAQFCVMRIFTYGDNTIRDSFIKSFYGNICKLSSNAISSKIIDSIYLSWANSKQKSYMKQEFYGDIYKSTKDQNVNTLSDTYKNSPNLKSSILKAVKSNLEHIANKKLIDNSLVHSVLLEYLQESSDAERNEIIALYSPLVPSLITTKDGCHAAILMFWHSATKERRAFVKTLKEHMLKTYIHEHGHVLLLAIINSLDDTKAIKKVIFDPILADIETVITNQWGRKVIAWFVSPGITEFFHPHLVSFLDEGLQYSKKEKEIRRKELFEQVEAHLADEIAKNTSFWLQDGHIGLFTANLIKRMTSDCLTKVAKSISKVICDLEWNVKVMEKKSEGKLSTILSQHANEKNIRGIEDPGLHIALKKMIKQDKDRVSAMTPTFGSFIVKELTNEKVNEWLTLNRACFILLTILQNSDNETKATLEEILKSNKGILQKQTHVGAELLQKELSL